MSRLIYILLIVLLISACSVQDTDVDSAMEEKVSSLMNEMTLDEKIGQLNLPAAGDIVTGQAKNSNIAEKIKKGKVGGLFNLKTAARIREIQRIAVDESRLGIPLIFGMDVIHGYKTVFPIPLGLSATWDMEAVEKMAYVSAQEASADGISWTFSPMVDISRDPRWGRVSEGGGEDPYLGSEIAKAMVKGYQGNDLSANNTIMACVKHFALYGAAESGRDYNTTDMSRVRMYNEYFEPYKAAIDAGAGSVMSSFNEVDGIPASANKWLMTDVLRKQWGFDGFVVTDYTAILEMVAHGIGDFQQVSEIALKAGIDMDMVSEGLAEPLKVAIEKGTIKEKEIDIACRRILEAKYKLGLFDDPYKYCDLERAEKEIYTPENRSIARDVATKSFVLLKNQDNLLPISPQRKIALIGPMANNSVNMQGTWSVAGDHAKSVNILDGLKKAIGKNGSVKYARGTNIVSSAELESRISIFGKDTKRDSRSEKEMIREAVSIANKSDVVVAVLGESSEMSGECASTTDIGLPENQKALLKELLNTGKPVVMVLLTGRPLSLTWEQENVPAILNAWFAGSEAGDAIADVLFGKVNPSGKLTISFPQNVGQVPIFYNHKNTGRPLEKGTWFQKFRSNYLDVSNEPLYPFGFGLSYTSFEYGDIKLSKHKLIGDEELTVTVDITNTGKRDGREIVQLYIRDLVGSITRPVKELKGFEIADIKAGETKQVTFTITTDKLKFYNYNLDYDWESGEFEIMVGPNSRDVKSTSINWIKE